MEELIRSFAILMLCAASIVQSLTIKKHTERISELEHHVASLARATLLILNECECCESVEQDAG